MISNHSLTLIVPVSISSIYSMLNKYTNCLEDPRVALFQYGDILAWFGDENKITNVTFDAILVDEK